MDITNAFEVGQRVKAVTAEQLRAVAASNERPSDWMYHDMRCASRQFGSDRGRCDCGYKQEAR